MNAGVPDGSGTHGGDTSSDKIARRGSCFVLPVLFFADEFPGLLGGACNRGTVESASRRRLGSKSHRLSREVLSQGMEHGTP